MKRRHELLATAVALTAMVLLTACAGKSLRPGESAPLTDKAGKAYGTRVQVAENVERHRIDADQDGSVEKQYDFNRGVITYSEHYYPDGKVRVRTSYLNGKANRSEVFNPDGTLRGIAYHSPQELVDTVDLPSRNRRVEFLPQK